MRPLLILLTSLALTARGQDTNQFHAHASTVNLIETGRVPIVVAEWGNQRITLRCPIGFGAHIDEFARNIKFDTASGAVVINVLFTTNSPGQLPPLDDLKALAVARHPGSWVLQNGTLFTGYQPGQFIDLAQRPTGAVSLRLRHGFVATPLGAVEFALGAGDADFEKYRDAFMQTAGSFTVEIIKPKEDGQ